MITWLVGWFLDEEQINNQIILFCIAGAFAKIFVDVHFYEEALEQLKKDIKLSISKSELFNSSQAFFSNTSEALDYVVGKIPNASRIWNTRLQATDDASNLHDISQRIEKMNALIKEQISKKGANFKIVCNSEQVKSIDFFQKIDKEEALVYILHNCSQPLLQMMILEYEDGKYEAFIGWVFDKKANQTGVWVIRDKKAVEFFIKLFEVYARYAETSSENAIY